MACPGTTYVMCSAALPCAVQLQLNIIRSASQHRHHPPARLPCPAPAHLPPQALSKESHLLNGALGRSPSAACSRAAYRSYFPTVLRRWWVERVLRVGKVRGTRAGGSGGP